MTEINFPIRGWNTNQPQNMQADGNSPDLLNVVPFDRDYVLRGAVRPGCSKFSVTQLGNGGQPILLLGQVALALDPSSIEPSILLLDEPFIYTDGTNVNAIDTMPADSSPDWRVSRGSVSFFPFTTPGNYLGIKTNRVVAQNVTGTGMFAAIYQPSLALGSSYIIKATVTMFVGQGASQDNDGLGIVFRVNKGTYAEDGIIYGINIGGLFLRNNSGSESFTSSFVPTVGDHDLELHVSGNVVTCYYDGLLKMTHTMTTNSTQAGVGVVVGKNITSGSGGGIKKVQIYAGAPLASFRQTNVVAVCGGNVYTSITGIFTLATSGGGALAETIRPQMASFGGVCYFVDSKSKMKALDLTTKVVADIVPSTGLETATTLGAYSLACTWNGRIVVAASLAFPMNFIMSRQNDPTDWDFSQTDVGAAIDGNAARAGAIGDPLNALMPWTDDILILGGDHSIYSVQGNIAAGGQILNVSEAVGTLGPDCWDIDPSGNLYFVGTGGIFKMTPGSTTPVNIASETVRDYFASINRVTHYVILTWDRDRNGFMIHVTPANTGTATHLFYDASNQGFFPVQYPTSFGPVSVISFDGDGPEDRQVLLGCRDGYVRTVDPAALSDDGTDINSYVFIGPFRPSGDGALSVLEALEIILGESPAGFTQNDFGLTITVQCGTDAYRALHFPERTFSFTLDQRVARRKRMLQRLSGGTFFFKISGRPSRLWSLEKLIAVFTQGGLQRRWATNQD